MVQDRRWDGYSILFLSSDSFLSVANGFVVLEEVSSGKLRPVKGPWLSL
jgi:hypothetical protein